MTGRKIATALVISIGASVGLAITYLAGGNPQWEGALLGAAFGGIGWALVVAAHDFLSEDGSEERIDLASPELDTDTVETELSEPTTRRGFLVAILGASVGALAVALGFPIRSLGQRPGRELFETSWRFGVRLVDDNGEPIAANTLETGAAMTVFPEGARDAADSVAILLRVNSNDLVLSANRKQWAPEGYIAFSKICTHAGCPVGLFDVDTGYLVCPCHQSSFDVLHGATPRFGPAARPLPQLPIVIDENGYLVSNGEMSGPVGPGFSNLPEGEQS